LYDWDEFDQVYNDTKNMSMCVEQEHFTEFFGLREMTQRESMIVLLYFSFTSLTTVGFGDFNPRSDVERVFIALSLLFGVAIFSMIMNEFIEMIQKKFKYDSLGEGDKLR